MGFSLQCDSSCTGCEGLLAPSMQRPKQKGIEETVGKVVFALPILKVVDELSLPGYSDFYNLKGFAYKEMANNTLKNVY